MLSKGWEQEDLSIENTIDNLYLIAAREKINCSLEDYLSLVRDEFSRRTIDENQSELKLNHRGRVAMNVQDIESGIELGKQIISQRKEMGKE